MLAIIWEKCGILDKQSDGLEGDSAEEGGGGGGPEGQVGRQQPPAADARRPQRHGAGVHVAQAERHPRQRHPRPGVVQPEVVVGGVRRRGRGVAAPAAGGAVRHHHDGGPPQVDPLHPGAAPLQRRHAGGRAGHVGAEGGGAAELHAGAERQAAGGGGRIYVAHGEARARGLMAGLGRHVSLLFSSPINGVACCLMNEQLFPLSPSLLYVLNWVRTFPLSYGKCGKKRRKKPPRRRNGQRRRRRRRRRKVFSWTQNKHFLFSLGRRRCIRGGRRSNSMIIGLP